MDSSPPPDVAGVRDTTYAALGAWRQRAARVGHQPLIREHGWTLAFVCVAAVAFVVLFMAGRHGTFYGDEWYFIGSGASARSTTGCGRGVSTVIRAARSVYRAIFSVIQLHSYLPYLAVLLTVHVAGGAALYILIRRASGPFVALCAATVFLLLGSGVPLNLLWAFQLGFVISTATGLWAIVAFERGYRRGDVIGAILVMLSLALVGQGIAFAVAVGVELLARLPGRSPGSCPSGSPSLLGS